MPCPHVFVLPHLLLLLLLTLQGCRPLSEAVYSIDKLAGHSSVVLELVDTAGRQLSPVEALQRELQQVTAGLNYTLHVVALFHDCWRCAADKAATDAS
jgi:hypothetical protein